MTQEFELILILAQEAIFEKRLLGGISDASVSRLVDISGEASKVSEKYRLVESVMGADNQYVRFIPLSWTSMVQIKTNHYKALSHYFVALALSHRVSSPTVKLFFFYFRSFFYSTFQIIFYFRNSHQ